MLYNTYLSGHFDNLYLRTYVSYGQNLLTRIPSTNRNLAKMWIDGSRVTTFGFSIWLHTQQEVINLTMCK